MQQHKRYFFALHRKIFILIRLSIAQSIGNMAKLTTIQLREETRKQLEQRKQNPKESYDAVIQRMIDFEDVPTMEEMFKRADNMKMDKEYTPQEIVKMIKDLREGSYDFH